MSLEFLAEKLALLFPLVLSLSLHELAHARTALAFGDPTARNMGRCTLNPLAHLDPVGTLALLFCGFGWAKPVPVNPHNLHPSKWGNIAVSFAGPFSNLILGILVGLVLRLMWILDVPFDSPLGAALWAIGSFTMAANLCLFVFNMVPLYPLDGHHIFREQLPADMQTGFMQWQLRYGRLVLMGLIFAPFLVQTMGIEGIDPLSLLFGHVQDLAFDVLVVP